MVEGTTASQYEMDAGNVRDPVQALAEATGASIVISGADYRRGETVLYQVEVTDAIRGQSLGALDPESVPITSPDEAITWTPRVTAKPLSRISDEAVGSLQKLLTFHRLARTCRRLLAAKG